MAYNKLNDALSGKKPDENVARQLAAARPTKVMGKPVKQGLNGPSTDPSMVAANAAAKARSDAYLAKNKPK